MKGFYSPFCGVFATKHGRFQSFGVIPPIGRSPRWDLHPFSVRDSCYFTLIRSFTFSTLGENFGKPTLGVAAAAVGRFRVAAFMLGLLAGESFVISVIL